MATINGIEPIDAYWYRTNFNQILLAVLDSGGNSSNLDVRGFRYTCDKSTSTDLNDVYMEYSITSYSPVDSDRGPLPLPITFRTGIETSRHGSFNDNIEVDELVVYYANDGNSNVSITTNKYGNGQFAPISSNTAFVNFAIMVRTTDGQIIDYWNNRELAIDKVHSGNVNMANGTVCVSIPYDYDSTGYYNAFPYSAFCCINSFWETHEQSVSFKCSHKVCKSKASAYKYLKYGIDDGLEELGGEEEEEEHPTTSGIYVYDVNKFIYTDYAMQNNREQIHSRLEIEFTDFPTDIYDVNTHFEPIVCYVDDNNYDSSVQFKIHSGFEEYITNCTIRIGNIETPITNPVTAVEGLSSFGYGMGFNSSVDGYVKYMVHTNITIIGADGTALPPTNQLGSDVMITTSNNANFDVGLSECWILSEHNMKKLARCFNTTVNKLADNSGGYIVAEWLLGLASYSNPLDVVCDLFYLPIDVSGFTDVDNGHFNFTPTLTEIEESE